MPAGVPTQGLHDADRLAAPGGICLPARAPAWQTFRSGRGTRAGRARASERCVTVVRRQGRHGKPERVDNCLAR